jgi:hypothetical protein
LYPAAGVVLSVVRGVGGKRPARSSAKRGARAAVGRDFAELLDLALALSEIGLVAPPWLPEALQRQAADTAPAGPAAQTVHGTGCTS